MRGNRGQSLIPGNDRAWKDRSQFFYKLEGFGCCSTDPAIHLTRDSHYDVIDFLFPNNFGQARCGLCIRWDRFQRMRQQP